jgi:SAM-dependent methyltransferase
MHDDATRNRLIDEQADPRRHQFCLDLYNTGDPEADAERFLASVEFAETRSVLRDAHVGGVLVDIGAGTGTGAASYAFAATGAQRVIAVEPEAGAFGRDAIARAAGDLPVEAVAGTGELIPVEDGSADVVYGRQVLHHADDLSRLAAEVARVLKPGGIAFFTREPVVTSEKKRRAWMAQHSHLCPGEQPYLLDEYRAASGGAQLQIEREFSHWELVGNAFPQVRSSADIHNYGRDRLRARLGPTGDIVGRIPGTGAAVRRLSRLRMPNENYSFLLRSAPARRGETTPGQSDPVSDSPGPRPHTRRPVPRTEA